MLKKEIFKPVIIHACDYKSAAGILQSDRNFDTILLDVQLPDKSGQELVTAMLAITHLCCPIIILSGYAEMGFSIRSISQGILDYLPKDGLSSATLYKSIIYSIERKKNILELKQSHDQYSNLFQLSPQPMCLYEQGTFRFVEINRAAIEHYGFSKEEFLGMTMLDLLPETEKQKVQDIIISQKRMVNQTYTAKFKSFNKNGDLTDVETFSTPIVINGKEYTLVIAIDITEKILFESMLTKAIIKTQEDERYEIGSELHDNVCQLLATGLMSLGMIAESVPAEKKIFLEQCKDYIIMGLDEIRNLSHRLAPAFFDDSTLEEAFERLLRAFNIENKYELSLKIERAFKEYPVSLDLKLNLYRILQEQLKNIAKYSKARLIKVQVGVENEMLSMKISDNGVGFKPAETKGGIGLANIRRRAELFSGTSDIISSPGKGCELDIHIPLRCAG